MIALLSPLLGMMLVLRLIKGKSRKGWDERWGRIPQTLQNKSGTRIWIHAASVGEVMAAFPILDQLKLRVPDSEIVLSTITPGGYETGLGLVGKTVSSVVYAPFDVPFAVRRTLRAIQPEMLIVMETELWPNMLCLAHQSGAQIVLANGRISDRSFGTYRRLRWLFSWALDQFDSILAQTETDAKRLVEIGADSARVKVIGNSKFDQAADKLSEEEVRNLRAAFHIADGAPVLVVGSTRTAEEEREIIRAYQIALKSLPDFVLIHAPRHVERARELTGIMQNAGLSPVMRTELEGTEGHHRQIILNTFGELGKVYAIADVAYIGNSLLPPGGGQNLLQPLAQGKPTLYGPFMANFRDLTAMSEAARVSFRVNSAEELGERIVTLIGNAELRTSLSHRAVELVRSNLGASTRYADEMVKLVTENCRARAK